MLENLPRFLMLHGPRNDCHPFAEELLRRDIANAMLQDDLSHCLIEGMIQSLFNGAWLEVDPEKPETWDRLLPVGVPTSIHTYIDHLADLHRSLLGEDILGQIYLKDYLANGYDEMLHTIVIRDYNHVQDAKPFLAKYSQSAIACVHIGKMDNFKPPINRNYWVPTLDPKSQVDQFLHDLQQEGRRSA
jgi:hypothetical protein